MESSCETTVTPPSSRSVSPSSSSSPPPPPSLVVSPCAACKILRRRCAEKCVLAPYFPPTDPLKFTTAHRVFGASNIIKFLQELPESQRADAVSSMVYEANARLRDPVYGSAGAICHLQKQVSELQAQLAQTQAELLNMQFQLQAQVANHLMARVCMEMPPPPPLPLHHQSGFDSFGAVTAATETAQHHGLLSTLSSLDDNNNNFGHSFSWELQTMWT
ncbi:PREDICTED: LOB domain-containing protein 1 [Ipomoea nil]|uniref:LOB domain-containing protein 1 n=1 Tax=Ipomoea nil TaxID=35883 RepID=UPI000901B6B8|nr:PREDICTED: LOB domain-containing protein 1 [Ipomoea nil]